MKKLRKTKDEEVRLIFDYDNFVTKSSQQRYYELKKEVRNKIEKIGDEINIAGSNEKEKKYNLLMCYKYMLENYNIHRKEDKLLMDLTLSFIKDSVLIITAVFSALLGYGLFKPQSVLANSILIFICASIIIVGVTCLYKEQVRNEKEKLKKDSQEYLYYKFYYKELKKYIKED